MYKGYIYRHWLINDKEQEKSYIGQVYNRIPEYRWNDGKGYLGKHKGREVDHKMARAIKKYGWNSFSHEILLTIECETKEELWFWLDEWEKWYVEKYDSYYNGYNCTLGGSGTRGYKMNEKDRQKMSDGRKGMKFTEEHKQHLSDSKKQKFASGEIAIWNLGKETPDSTRHKQSKAKKGKPCSEETKRKLSEAFSGENHPMYGKHHTDESKRKNSESRKGKCTGSNNPRARAVICLNTLEVFTTMKDAGQWCKIKNYSNIGGCCRGTRSYAGKHPITGEKLHWQYYDEYLKLQEERQNNDNSDTTTNVA